MLRYLVALTLFVALSSNAHAQSAADPREWTDDFMQTLVDDGAEVAHRKLRRSHLAELRPHAIGGVLGNMKAVENSYGKSLGFEFTGQRNTGQSIRVLGYMSKREILPVLWTFTFYSPVPDKWQLVHFRIIDDMGYLEAPD